MASRRRIEAYERKLAKIATEGKPLDAGCLMAVATVYDFHEEDERVYTPCPGPRPTVVIHGPGGPGRILRAERRAE